MYALHPRAPRLCHDGAGRGHKRRQAPRLRPRRALQHRGLRLARALHRGGGRFQGLLRLPARHIPFFSQDLLQQYPRRRGLPGLRLSPDRLCHRMPHGRYGPRARHGPAGFPPEEHRAQRRHLSLNGKPVATLGISDCLEEGRKKFRWDERKAACKAFNEEAVRTGSPLRRGVGVSAFSYGSGTYPPMWNRAAPASS